MAAEALVPQFTLFCRKLPEHLDARDTLSIHPDHADLAARGVQWWSWSVIGCAFWLVFPSIGTVSKYLGVLGLVAYIAAVPSALWVIRAWVLPRLTSYLTERQALVLAFVTLLGLIAIFLCVHPLATAPRAGHGSDRNEAMNLATDEVLHGRFPYYPTTHLGNPISPLPGSLLLATPFVLLGDSAYQTFFWIAVFFAVVRREVQDTRKALLLVWVALALSPVVLQETVTGGDLLANGLYVLVFALGLLHRARRRSGWLYAALLGVGLSSRANFLLLLPLVLSALAERAGWGRAAKLAAVCCATFAIITGPFYVANPQGFTPLHTLRKFDAASSFPLAGVVVLLLDVSLAVALSSLRQKWGDATLLRNCAIVLAAPVTLLAALVSIRTGTAGFASAGYGLSFLFFGLLACAAPGGGFLASGRSLSRVQSEEL